MKSRFAALSILLSLVATDLLAVNWAKAMNLYYKDFNPVKEMLITLGIIVAVGVGTYFYQKAKKQRAEKRRQERSKPKDFNDFL